MGFIGNAIWFIFDKFATLHTKTGWRWAKQMANLFAKILRRYIQKRFKH